MDILDDIVNYYFELIIYFGKSDYAFRYQ